MHALKIVYVFSRFQFFFVARSNGAHDGSLWPLWVRLIFAIGRSFDFISFRLRIRMARPARTMPQPINYRFIPKSKRNRNSKSSAAAVCVRKNMLCSPHTTVSCSAHVHRSCLCVCKISRFSWLHQSASEKSGARRFFFCSARKKTNERKCLFEDMHSHCIR